MRRGADIGVRCEGRGALSVSTRFPDKDGEPGRWGGGASGPSGSPPRRTRVMGAIAAPNGPPFLSFTQRTSHLCESVSPIFGPIARRRSPRLRQGPSGSALPSLAASRPPAGLSSPVLLLQFAKLGGRPSRVQGHPDSGRLIGMARNAACGPGAPIRSAGPRGGPARHYRGLPEAGMNM